LPRMHELFQPNSRILGYLQNQSSNMRALLS